MAEAEREHTCGSAALVGARRVWEEVALAAIDMNLQCLRAHVKHGPL